jgi:hypothetical protein
MNLWNLKKKDNTMKKKLTKKIQNGRENKVGK